MKEIFKRLVSIPENNETIDMNERFKKAQQQIREHYKKLLMGKLRWEEKRLLFNNKMFLEVYSIFYAQHVEVREYFFKVKNVSCKTLDDAKAYREQQAEKFIDELLQDGDR